MKGVPGRPLVFLRGPDSFKAVVMWAESRSSKGCHNKKKKKLPIEPENNFHVALNLMLGHRPKSCSRTPRVVVPFSSLTKPSKNKESLLAIPRLPVKVVEQCFG